MIELFIVITTCFLPGFIGFYITSKKEEEEERRRANRKRWRKIMREEGFYIWEK